MGSSSFGRHLSGLMSLLLDLGRALGLAPTLDHLSGLMTFQNAPFLCPGWGGAALRFWVGLYLMGRCCFKAQAPGIGHDSRVLKLDVC